MLTQEQIEMRMQGVGGSDMPVIAGLPEARATARELYHVKRGEIDGDEIYRRIHGAGNDGVRVDRLSSPGFHDPGGESVGFDLGGRS